MTHKEVPKSGAPGPTWPLKVSAAFAEAGIAHMLELTSSGYYDDRIVVNEHLIVQVGRHEDYLCVLYDGCEIAADEDYLCDAFKKHASESQVLRAAIATVAEELMWIADEDSESSELKARIVETATAEEV